MILAKQIRLFLRWGFLLFILIGALARASETAQSPSGFYYYCQKSAAYYPAVSTCEEGWIAMPVTAPPPIPEHGFWGWREPLTHEQSLELLQSRPEVISLEVMGKALDYSFDLTHALSDRWAIGVGVSSWRQSYTWTDEMATVTVVPVYGNYYFDDSLDRGFVTVGADLIQVSKKGDPNDPFETNGVAGVIGGGLESRQKDGFVVRLGLYAIVGGSVVTSPGLSIGYSFK